MSFLAVLWNVCLTCKDKNKLFHKSAYLITVKMPSKMASRPTWNCLLCWGHFLWHSFLAFLSALLIYLSVRPSRWFSGRQLSCIRGHKIMSWFLSLLPFLPLSRLYLSTQLYVRVYGKATEHSKYINSDKPHVVLLFIHSCTNFTRQNAFMGWKTR